MKKDKNGNEIGKGIIKYSNNYYKVFNVIQGKLVISHRHTSLILAKGNTEVFGIWGDLGLENIEQIEYESLGVFDSNGREYKVGDTIELWKGAIGTVLNGVKSINNDKINFIHYKCDGGWD